MKYENETAEARRASAVFFKWKMQSPN